MSCGKCCVSKPREAAETWLRIPKRYQNWRGSHNNNNNNNNNNNDNGNNDNDDDDVYDDNNRWIGRSIDQSLVTFRST